MHSIVTVTDFLTHIACLHSLIRSECPNLSVCVKKLAVVAASKEFDMGRMKCSQFENSALNEISVAIARIRDKARCVQKLKRGIPGYKKTKNARKYYKHFLDWKNL